MLLHNLAQLRILRLKLPAQLLQIFGNLLTSTKNEVNNLGSDPLTDWCKGLTNRLEGLLNFVYALSEACPVQEREEEKT